jgi:hypothetical protein
VLALGSFLLFRAGFAAASAFVSRLLRCVARRTFTMLGYVGRAASSFRGQLSACGLQVHRPRLLESVSVKRKVWYWCLSIYWLLRIVCGWQSAEVFFFRANRLLAAERFGLRRNTTVHIPKTKRFVLGSVDSEFMLRYIGIPGFWEGCLFL